MEKAIWITGASSGIGKAIASKFSQKGYMVIASARRWEKLIELKEEAMSFGGKIETLICDISQKESVQDAWMSISGRYQIDCLINNAGITSFKPFEMNTPEEAENIIQTNLLGPIYTIKSVLPEMIKNGGGTIINMLSVITEKVFTNSSLYSASKNGLLAFANVLREEQRKNNIRVVNISPGATETEIWPEETRSHYSSRMMKPDEIAELALFAYEQNGNMSIENIVARPMGGDL